MAEKSNAERYKTHFSAFDISAISGFCFALNEQPGTSNSAYLQSQWVARVDRLVEEKERKRRDAEHAELISLVSLCDLLNSAFNRLFLATGRGYRSAINPNRKVRRARTLSFSACDTLGGDVRIDRDRLGKVALLPVDTLAPTETHFHFVHDHRLSVQIVAHRRELYRNHPEGWPKQLACLVRHDLARHLGIWDNNRSQLPGAPSSVTLFEHRPDKT
jgi:hypothetical protein